MMITELLNHRLDGYKVSHTASVKLDVTGTGKDDPSHKITFKVDFTGWTVQDLANLAIRPLVIAAQRVWRGLSVEQFNALNGTTFLASDMGKKPTQQIDVQATYMAIFANASPEEQAKMLADLQAKAKQD